MLQLGTLKGFNSTDYRAEVQLAGSMAAYLDNIPVARNITSAQMTVGRHVILAIPRGNPRDACVIAVWDGAAGGGGSGGGGASTFLDLTDTPASYVGQASKFTRVKADESALEFHDHAALTTGVHGVGALHAAGFHSAGQAVSKIIWKDASERALEILNSTTPVAWTVLDLTAYTSANAKFAILNLVMHCPITGTAGWSTFHVRKNGTTPDNDWSTAISYNLDNDSQHRFCAIIGLDAGQAVEYKIAIATGATVSCTLDVMGYIE